jgi:hypothetical protein
MDRLAAILDAASGEKALASAWWNATSALRYTSAHEDPWRALEHAKVTLGLAEELDHQFLVSSSRVFEGMGLWCLGAPVAAEQILSSLPAFVDTALATASASRRFSLAWLRAERGAFEEARLSATQLRDFGREHRAPLDEGRGCWVLAEVLRRAGDAEGAEREIQAALALFQATSHLDYPGALGTLAALRLSQGRAAEALAAAEEAVACSEAIGGGCSMLRGAFVRLTHAEALHEAGAHDAARAAIKKARERLLAIAASIAEPDYKKSFLENVPENARTFGSRSGEIGATGDPRRFSNNWP